jgi:hypothetical protein
LVSNACHFKLLNASQVEVAGWLGPDTIKSLLLDKMPDMMRKDTEKLVEEAGAGFRKQPQRYTRKEAAKRAMAAPPTALPAGPAAAMAGASSATEGAEMDGADMVSSRHVINVHGRLREDGRPLTGLKYSAVS